MTRTTLDRKAAAIRVDISDTIQEARYALDAIEDGLVEGNEIPD